MSQATPNVIAWGLLTLVCLGLMAVISGFDGKHEPAVAVTQAVVIEVAESPRPDVREWIDVGARVSWGLFLLLVCFLGFGLWLFVCRVAYADSDLFRPVGQLPSGDSPIPRPDTLPLEGD